MIFEILPPGQVWQDREPLACSFAGYYLHFQKQFRGCQDANAAAPSSHHFHSFMHFFQPCSQQSFSFCQLFIPPWLVSVTAFQRPGVGPKDQIRSDATAVEAAQGRIPDAWD